MHVDTARQQRNVDKTNNVDSAGSGARAAGASSTTSAALAAAAAAAAPCKDYRVRGPFTKEAFHSAGPGASVNS